MSRRAWSGGRRAYNDCEYYSCLLYTSVQREGAGSVAGSARGHDKGNVEHLERAADVVKEYEVHHQHDGRDLDVFEQMPDVYKRQTCVSSRRGPK